MMNEYFTANSLLNPHARPAVIVEPDLEIPGRVAIPCARPINNEFLYVASAGPLLPF